MREDPKPKQTDQRPDQLGLETKETKTLKQLSRRRINRSRSMAS